MTVLAALVRRRLAPDASTLDVWQSWLRRGAAGSWMFRASLFLFLLWSGSAPLHAESVKDLRLSVNGETRRYVVVTPDGVTTPAPTVIALHGAAQTPESFRAYFGLDAAAAKHGFVAVYPEGEGRTWNDGRPAAMRLKMMLRPGDDVAFLVALARRLAADGIADPNRIYLTGISNGGFMVQRMACEYAELFAAYSAIMSTAPANYKEECQPSKPVSIQFIHGTADSVIGYAGFWTPLGSTLSAPDSARLYAALDGCGPATSTKLPDLAPDDGTTAELRRWEGCRDGSAVELITIERGGHQSPAMVETKPDLATPFLGLRSHDIDAGEEIWRFMSVYGGVPAAVAPAAPPRKPKLKPAGSGASAKPPATTSGSADGSKPAEAKPPAAKPQGASAAPPTASAGAASGAAGQRGISAQ